MGATANWTAVSRRTWAEPRSVDSRQCVRFGVLLLQLLFCLFVARTDAQEPNSTEPLQGLWLTDGYGLLIEFPAGNSLHTFELTKLSCIPASAAVRTSSTGGEAVFKGNGDTLRVSPGISADTRWLHVDGSVSSVLIRRTGSWPRTCHRKLANTPPRNYEVLWNTFVEHYPFFQLRQVNWITTDKRFRPQVTAATQPKELFHIFSEMITPLHDRHTRISASDIHEEFHGYRPTTDAFQSKNATRITEIIEIQYAHGHLRNFCNRQLQYGVLNDSVGYLRIHSFANYSDTPEFVKQLDALETALDTILQDSANLTGLILDVRINTGGSDVFGISIASRLAVHEYLGYSKVVRNNVHDVRHRTPPQPVIVRVSPRPGFRGSVVLLTSSDSISAAETFTMALLGREPHVTRLGQNTQGVFSDVLDRKLPNGWTFGLPNEIYLTKEGKAFDGTGVPPDIEIPNFSASDLLKGRDTALDQALEILSHANVKPTTHSAFPGVGDSAWMRLRGARWH